MKDLLNDLEGNILLINVEDKYKKIVNNNSNILESYYLDKIKKKKYKSNKYAFDDIKLNRIKKLFKKKCVNYTLINLTEIYKDRIELVKQSITITNKEIIIYSKLDKYEFDRIVNMYKRYTKNILVFKDYVIIKIDNTKYNNIFNIFYCIKDKIIDFIDILGNGLMN